MRVILALVVAFVAFNVGGIVGYFLFADLGIPFLGFLISPAAAIFAFVWAMRRGKETAPKSYPEGFTPTYAHDNIAIDVPNGKLWLRDQSGYSAVLNKGDVLGWSEAYVTYGVHHTRNRLEVNVRDLGRPKFEVPFRRHMDTFKWGAKKNYAELQEWHSRLTAWVNNT